MNDIVKKYLLEKYGTETPEEQIQADYEDQRVNPFAQMMSGVGQAMSGRGTDFSWVDKANKQAYDRTINQLEQDKKDAVLNFQVQQDYKKAQEEDDLNKRLEDLNSIETKSYQSLAKKMLPHQDFSGLHGKQILAQLPSLEKIYKIESDRQARVDAKKAQEDVRVERMNEKKKEKAKLSDKQTTELASHEKAIRALDDVIAQKQTQNWDTGKLSFSLNKISSWVGLDDAQKSAFKSNVGEQLAQYIKNISGATVSPTERAALLENVPSVYDNDDTFMEKANALKNRLERNRNIEIDFLEKQGKSVAQFRDPKEENLFSQEDVKAFKWAKNNPNDPRAQEILKMYGMK